MSPRGRIKEEELIREDYGEVAHTTIKERAGAISNAKLPRKII